QSLLLLFLAAVFLDALAAPPPSGATVLPGTPRFALECLEYPPHLQPGDPDSCDSLFRTGIQAMTDDRDKPFLFTTDSARAPEPYGAVPITISSTSSDGFGNSSNHRFSLIPPSNISTSTDDGDTCSITFRFRGGTAPDHEESWHTRLLLQNAIIAWGNCVAYGPPGPPTYGVIIPKPKSEVLRLEIEVRTAKGVTHTAVQ
ncbi:MAG: hypothetical protein Q9191_008230, partial [Dirinaria sp. TL-2023a]